MASPARPDPPPPPTTAKIVIAGGFGVGKTTFVGAVSEIVPLTTEAALTTASASVDDTDGLPRKRTTTVAMDFGRLTLAESVVLYLFGTPGQDRYWFMWDDVVNGAIGGIVLVDTRRLADSFSAVDFLEDRGMPIVIAVNCFDGVMAYTASDIRDALAVPSRVPIVFCDARDRETVRRSLVTLVELALAGSERPARPRRAVPRRERHGAGRRPTAGSRFGRPF